MVVEITNKMSGPGDSVRTTLLARKSKIVFKSIKGKIIDIFANRIKYLKMIERLESELLPLRIKLKNHSIYNKIESLGDIQIFMESHVFAVWDFMSLLKKLQSILSCNQIPWYPSGFPKASRLINEIVWGEESDVNQEGIPMSHFEMYLDAMKNIKANTKEINHLINEVRSCNDIFDIINKSSLPKYVKNFVDFTFEVIQTEKPHVIAAVFTFGREDLIPDMFIEIIKNLKASTNEDLSDLIYYFERHIEVDSGEHGPLALEMIKELCQNDKTKWEEALSYSKQALENRINLWDGILSSISIKSKLVTAN